MSPENVAAVGEEERQVYDIPSIRIEVTSHRAEIKICPGCGAENRGEFPESVGRGVRYGTGVKTYAAYFGNQHHVPLERTAQVIEDPTGHSVSEASLLNADETGVRVKGKLHRLHVASTDGLTHYSVHAKRGKETTDAAGILENFTGTAVHDHWKP